MSEKLLSLSAELVETAEFVAVCLDDHDADELPDALLNRTHLLVTQATTALSAVAQELEAGLVAVAKNKVRTRGYSGKGKSLRWKKAGTENED